MFSYVVARLAAAIVKVSEVFVILSVFDLPKNNSHLIHE